jgi:hypothetical protein
MEKHKSDLAYSSRLSLSQGGNICVWKSIITQSIIAKRMTILNTAEGTLFRIRANQACKVVI